ncbi:TVP38/TMEM64 family protein [Luteibacter pinisoli]|uniref:TVP38/TMEM64 family membrane protein n=1 Tax=Luteibacter pinisoli TaxID=2589080 RepID=A0A4Y5Z734_9GAMM|nr:TVP38/TMEM64 family protein [Luteibacter pinisoli]
MAKAAPPTEVPARGRRAWRAVLPLVLMVALGVAAVGSGVLDTVDASHLVRGEGSLDAFIGAHPLLSRLAFTGLLAVAIATGVPGTIMLVLAGGLLFGTVESTLLGPVALVAGSLALYAASRRAFSAGTRQPPAFAARLRERYLRHPVRHTFALRFVPVVPLGAMTIALAWLRCPLWLFVAATWVGGTVSIAVESAIGAGLGDTLGRGPMTAASLANARLLVPLALFLVIAAAPPLLKAWRERRGG